MELHIWLACIAAFILIIRPLLNRTRVKNRPPGPTGVPIFGNLLQLGPNLHETLSNFAKIYGPILSLRLGSVNFVVVSSPSIAQEILQKNDQTFGDHPVPEVIASQPNVENTIAWTTSDHRWRSRRNIFRSQMFSVQRLDSLQHARLRKVHELIEYLRKHSVSGTAVEIGKVAFATSFNFVSNTVFSVDVVDPNFESAGEFNDLIWKIMESGGKPNFSDYFPVLKRFDLQGLKRRAQASYLRLHQIFDEIIRKRLNTRATSMERHGDFLDVMLDHCEDESSGFTIETIKPIFTDLFVAGGDTTGISIEWAMAETLRNPEILRKARKEVLGVIGAEGEVTEGDIERLPYIRAIVKESLRLHPPAPLLLPYIASNDVVIGGFNVQKGDHVIINAWAVARDPEYWDEPLSFKPERFLGSDVDYKGRHFEFIPFGAGRRSCVGMALANRMAYLMLAAMIHSFDWKLPEGTTHTYMDMSEQFGITLKMAVPVRAIPVA